MTLTKSWLASAGYLLSNVAVSCFPSKLSSGGFVRMGYCCPAPSRISRAQAQISHVQGPSWKASVAARGGFIWDLAGIVGTIGK